MMKQMNSLNSFLPLPNSKIRIL